MTTAICPGCGIVVERKYWQKVTLDRAWIAKCPKCKRVFWVEYWVKEQK